MGSNAYFVTKKVHSFFSRKMMNQITNQFRNKNYIAFLVSNAPVFSRKVHFFSHANDESESTMRKKKLSSIKTRPSGPQCVLRQWKSMKEMSWPRHTFAKRKLVSTTNQWADRPANPQTDRMTDQPSWKNAYIQGLPSQNVFKEST